MRQESDSLGTLLLPDDAYYGIQTLRAVENFTVSNSTIADFPLLVKSLAMIKKATALTNMKIDVLRPVVANAICQAADEIIEGKFEKSQFPVNVFNAGGGVSPHMNINEVLANRANEIITGQKGYEIVHPNNHVNAGQSTCDVLHSAMTLALYFDLNELIESLKFLESVLAEKIVEYQDTVKLSRTCLQDAVPVTFGQSFSAYLSGVQRAKTRLEKVKQECLELPMGATAVGTGLSSSAGYIDWIYHYLKEVTGLPIRRHPNFFDALQNGDIYQLLSTTFKALATGLSKMYRDLRLLSSSPRTGMKEIILPAVQPGSSFMPGMICPTMPELINQIAYQVCGNDVTIAMAVEGAELELNAWESLIFKNLFESCQLLKQGIPLFTEKCVKGIVVRTEECRDQAENALAISVVISSIYGYKVGSKVAKHAFSTGKTIKESVIELNIMSEDLANELLDPLKLTVPTQSCEIPQRVAAAYKEATKAKIACIDLNTRQKIFEVITAVVLADSVIAKEEELIVYIASEALQLTISKDEIAQMLKTPVQPLSDLGKLNPADSKLIYSCAIWVALSDGSFDESEHQLIDKLQVAIGLEEKQAHDIYNKIVAIQKENSLYVPKSEELPWWDQFEQILVNALEL